MTSERVTCTIERGVADVRLNRADKLNALDMAMFAAIGETGDRLRADPAVRVVVISGEGRGFCAGLDMAMLAGSSVEGPSVEGPGVEGSGVEGPGVEGPGVEGPGVEGPSVPGLLSGRSGDRADNHAQHAAWVWHELEVPVIAALHGVVFGGGIQIALAADIRIAAPDSRLSVMEVRWGLVPDMTGTWTLPRLVGLDVAKELTWTGRTVSGEEALRLGLVTRLSGRPRAEALELARELASRSPEALRLAKSLLDQSLGRSEAEQLGAEEAAMRSVLGGADQQEAVAAELEKRPAKYSTRS